MAPDFLGNEFNTFKCSRCRKTFRNMIIDNDYKTCGNCSNKAQVDRLVAEENPKNLIANRHPDIPGDLLAAEDDPEPERFYDWMLWKSRQTK